MHNRNKTQFWLVIAFLASTPFVSSAVAQDSKYIPVTGNDSR